MSFTERPSAPRLTAIALRILEDALAQGHHGPVKPTLAHRLALAWLAYEKIGLDWHYLYFWQQMVEHTRPGDTYPNYLRTTTLTGLLDYWYTQLGWEAPCAVQRGQWARAHARTPNEPNIAERKP